MFNSSTDRDLSKRENIIKVICIVFALLAIFNVSIAFILSSQLGGMLQISYENYLLFFRFRYLIIFGSFLMVFYFVYANTKYKLFHKSTSLLLLIVVFGLAILARHYLPTISFSTYQHKAKYFSIAEAEEFIDAGEREMIVIEHNGVAKGYSNRLSFLPHIAGGKFGDDEVIMAYCVLSSLPIAFKDDLAGKKMDLSVLLAPANNLLMYEHNSGEFIRQLKLETEETGTPLMLVPVQKMPWSSFKKLYPDGEVFLPVNKNVFQKIMDTAIGDTIDPIIDDEKLFYRPSYVLNPLLPETERVWGVLVNNDPVAISKKHLDENRILQINLGGREIVVVYFDEYQTVGAFYNDEKLQIAYTDIDPYGNVGAVKLKRVEGLFNTVFWGVWSYFYPHTKLLN